ncbi:toll-like receptor 5 [Dreissena polymorpha]|nr:toll-like receptor 5 [Dreissena polymorpha]
MGPLAVNSSVSEVKIYLLCRAFFSSTCTMPSSTTRLTFVGGPNFQDADVLSLGGGCFDWAESLEELHFHGIRAVLLSRSTFRGLTNLRVLNMSLCFRLWYSYFLLAFQGVIAPLPKLEVLLLSTSGNLEPSDHFMLDNSMWAALAHTKLRYLDVSNTVIGKYNFSELFHYLPYLQFFNMSGFQLVNRTVSDHQFSDKYISSLEILDLSSIYADKSRIQHIIWCLVSSIRIDQPKSFNLSTTPLSKSLKTLLLNNLCGDKNGRNIENVRHIILRGQSVLQNLYLRENHWPIMDIEANLEALTHLELLDLSRDGIEFLNEKAFSSLVGLKTFLLSENKLGKMATTHTEMFARLFSSYNYLSFLDLSHNDIKTIPHEIFISNPLLVHVDLSQNRLTEITFKCKHLTALEVLNLRGNMLTVLDATTQATLDNLPYTTFVQISENTFSCSACKDYVTIEWMIKHEHVLDYDHLNCRNGNENLVNVNQTIRKYLKDVCEKPLKIKITIYVTVGIAMLFCVTGFASAYIIITRRKHRRKTRQRLDTITKVEDGRLDFLVFLQYSSKDENFVHTNVYPHLDGHLRRLVPINKDVISFGDKDFRVGKSILEETIRCTKSSAAVMLLLTDNFVKSEYCLNEFDVAFRVGKPVIMMLKGDVDMTRAPHVIRDLFHTYVRVLWKCDENGEYIMTTSLENVCNAILASG